MRNTDLFILKTIIEKYNSSIITDFKLGLKLIEVEKSITTKIEAIKELIKKQKLDYSQEEIDYVNSIQSIARDSSVEDKQVAVDKLFNKEIEESFLKKRQGIEAIELVEVEESFIKQIKFSKADVEKLQGLKANITLAELKVLSLLM